MLIPPFLLCRYKINNVGEIRNAICTFHGVTSHQQFKNQNIGSPRSKYSKKALKSTQIQIRRQGQLQSVIFFEAFPYIFKRQDFNQHSKFCVKRCYRLYKNAPIIKVVFIIIIINWQIVLVRMFVLIQGHCIVTEFPTQ